MMKISLLLSVLMTLPLTAMEKEHEKKTVYLPTSSITAMLQWSKSTDSYLQKLSVDLIGQLRLFVQGTTITGTMYIGFNRPLYPNPKLCVTENKEVNKVNSPEMAIRALFMQYKKLALNDPLVSIRVDSPDCQHWADNIEECKTIPYFPERFPYSFIKDLNEGDTFVLETPTHTLSLYVSHKEGYTNFCKSATKDEIASFEQAVIMKMDQFIKFPDYEISGEDDLIKEGILQKIPNSKYYTHGPQGFTNSDLAQGLIVKKNHEQQAAQMSKKHENMGCSVM